MNATQLRIVLLFGSASVACIPTFGTGNVGLAVLGVASSSVAECQFGAATPPLLSDRIVFDLAASERLRLPLVVRNDWHSTVAVKDMDFSWDCSSVGFMNGATSLYVARHDLDKSFCRETHDPNGQYVGFDVVAATGAPIEPGATGVVWVEIVPSELGRDFLDSLDLAVLADTCLDGNHSVHAFDTPECQAFAARLDEVAGRVHPTYVSTFARFASADGNHRLDEEPAPPTLGSGLDLQVRGLIRGLSGDDEVLSNEIIQGVELCRNCGGLIPGSPPTRAARTGFECYYEPASPR